MHVYAGSMHVNSLWLMCHELAAWAFWALIGVCKCVNRKCMQSKCKPYVLFTSSIDWFNACSFAESCCSFFNVMKLYSLKTAALNFSPYKCKIQSHIYLLKLFVPRVCLKSFSVLQLFALIQKTWFLSFECLYTLYALQFVLHNDCLCLSMHWVKGLDVTF